MFDTFWLPAFGAQITVFNSLKLVYQFEDVAGDLLPESKDNIRVVALSDAQLSCVMSALVSTEYISNWFTHYVEESARLFLVPDDPLGLSSIYGSEIKRTRLSDFSKELQDFQKQRIDVFTSELKEQLMIDLTPYFESLALSNEAQAAQLELIAADIAALRLEAEAESYADSLETLAEYAPLLLAVL